jgi:hypothetical protein
MQVLSFIKKLQIFDVIWGRRAKILHGIKDGGTKAIEIADPNIAKIYNGSTIFNVNSSVNECGGGHYHTVDITPVDHSKICLHFDITDWIGHKIEVISSGTPGPGQIGPHNLGTPCINSQVWQDEVSKFRQVGVEMFINPTNNNVTLWKTPRYDFKGRVILMGA